MTFVTPTHAELKTKHRDSRDGLDFNLDIRVHRALSWLRRAEFAVQSEDTDAAFIFYWIAFNAIYASGDPHRAGLSEKDTYSDFFRTIVQHDRERVIFDAIWNKFSDSIRVLINNRYVFQPFWDSVYREDDSWIAKFEDSKKQVTWALNRRDSIQILCILFGRLYVLRNQLIHGSATWNSSRNRSQVRDAMHVMEYFVPILIDLMIRHPEISWQPPIYPVLKD